MSDDRRAHALPLADEGSWAYLIASAEGPRSTDRLRDRVVDACEASGWPIVTRPASGTARTADPGHLFEDMRHAVEHADVVVALLDSVDTWLDAELALAYAHRRPIVGISLGEMSSGSEVQGMIERYERARVIACDDVDECGSDLRELFADSDFAMTVRGAGGEHAADV